MPPASYATLAGMGNVTTLGVACNSPFIFSETGGLPPGRAHHSPRGLSPPPRPPPIPPPRVDRIGGKPVLAAGVALWSLFTALIPPAATAGIAPLLATRVALGACEGVAFPSIHSLVSKHVPSSLQSSAVGIITAASYAGTAIAFYISPILIANFGWPSVFYIFGALGLLWLPIWLPMPLPPADRAAAISSRGSSDAGVSTSSAASAEAAYPAAIAATAAEGAAVLVPAGVAPPGVDMKVRGRQAFG